MAKKTVYSRLDISWYMMGAYLDIVRSLGNVARDEQFNKLFEALREYVDKQFFAQCQGEVSDVFVIAEQSIKGDSIK
ncbi:MAG: hypothetical protein K2F90_01640 [Clostridiales bacterium]|nr:hypothetical protein [Clostridiales bacterium]